MLLLASCKSACEEDVNNIYGGKEIIIFDGNAFCTRRVRVGRTCYFYQKHVVVSAVQMCVEKIYSQNIWQKQHCYIEGIVFLTKKPVLTWHN